MTLASSFMHSSNFSIVSFCLSVSVPSGFSGFVRPTSAISPTVCHRACIVQTASYFHTIARRLFSLCSSENERFKSLRCDNIIYTRYSCLITTQKSSLSTFARSLQLPVLYREVYCHTRNKSPEEERSYDKLLY